ncbi:uncharacterized protein EI90DRAFT_1881164 [Cantharellus anzutake]|uniref:uncharacterized protein n=1 Tax=Cantharellus anzutake TaxID=1750568 RepID=UPI0019051C31|nr:uncharacterized protein EI90DRAFT_1881164 [Cantharellus anzutake]KAF8326859.1 hypothetical protein EI90DRAFT_1881164 [Cantharellus anzutake]
MGGICFGAKREEAGIGCSCEIVYRMDQTARWIIFSSPRTVRSRLEAMGFASVFIALVIERGFTGLRLSKRLTNKEWAGIKRHAIRAIKECEQLYIESFCVREGERIVSSYRSWYECHDPGNEFWPPPPKIWTLDAIKDSLIEILRPNFHHLQGVDDYPEPPDITIDTLAPRFENIVNNHSISSRAELLGLVPVESRLSSVQETLELARTLFISSRFEPARYPCFAFANHWRWDERGSVIISDIIILAGHDPNVMTFAQLLEENIWVECLTCAQGNVLQAPEAVGHFHRHHPHLECVEWRILEGQELETTRAPNAEKRWSCLLCGYWKTCTEDLILEHIASQHPFARPDLQYCYMSVHGELPRKPMAHATGVSTANS